MTVSGENFGRRGIFHEFFLGLDRSSKALNQLRKRSALAVAVAEGSRLR
jgi:hypothetical protein